MPDTASNEPGSKVSDPQHSQRLLRVLRTFWQEQSFHDALLVVDGEELPVQKNILAAASPYIRTKLNYNPPKEDGSTYRIELQGVSMAIMKQILDYIFSGEITLREETIQDMVQASDLLLMTDLKSLCCQFLESCITAENCIGIRLFSLHYCLYHVHYVATEFLQTHFRDVALTEEFRELPPDRLCEVLSMEKLNVGNEKHVLEAVVRWFAHDPDDRRVRMKEVMSAVWLQGLDLSYLREQLQVGCYASMNKKLYAIGGGSYGKLFDSVECFDPKTQQWTGLCPLKERRFGSVACGVGQELYVFGGVRSQENDNPEQRQMTTCKSEFYHDEMRRWMFLDDQNLCIQTSSSFVYGAVPIGASIYVVGDLDTGTNFDYIREFRRTTGTWHRTKQMLPSDLSKTACANLRIANCRLFRLQLSQGMFRIRI
ncbi:gigaxonin [Neolamprologus brichardi]|uniref:gigaxonin n=1 Tax=Neolamprologus brichardi TaxID=32507 RepID=UPI001643BED2|nr:gigaxonin [Neolamprologus brichardi]